MPIYTIAEIITFHYSERERERERERVVVVLHLLRRIYLVHFFGYVIDP